MFDAVLSNTAQPLRHWAAAHALEVFIQNMTVNELMAAEGMRMDEFAATTPEYWETTPGPCTTEPTIKKLEMSERTGGMTAKPTETLRSFRGRVLTSLPSAHAIIEFPSEDI